MEQSPTPRRSRPYRNPWVVGTATAALVAAGVLSSTLSASAATLFSADFEDGSTSGWSKSGGTWAVASDGSKRAAGEQRRQ